MHSYFRSCERTSQTGLVTKPARCLAGPKRQKPGELSAMSGNPYAMAVVMTVNPMSIVPMAMNPSAVSVMVAGNPHSSTVWMGFDLNG